MSKRHFWKKNPTNFLKSRFWGMSKRHFRKKNPDYVYGYLPINFQNSLFRGMSKRHLWKKNPIEKNPSFASL